MNKLLHQHKWFFLILLTGLILRVALNSAVDSFDFYAFVMWARYLTEHSIAELFEFLPEGYTPYPPLYYYVLFLLGQIISVLGVWSNKWLTYLIIRLPVITADILVFTIVYRVAQSYFSKKLAPISAAFYFLHPAIIYNTSIWGQIDSVITVLGLASLLSLIAKKSFWGIGFYSMGVLTKLQSLALLPLVMFLSIKEIKVIPLIKNACIWLVLAVVPFLPVIVAKGPVWTWQYFFTIPNWYAYTSVYTLNLWAPFGFIVSDNTRLFGIVAYKYIGIALFWLVAVVILKPLLKKSLRRPLPILFAAFLLWYDFSFFATRIHSRYLIYSFGFFAPFFVRFPKLGLMLSVLMIVNFLLPLNTEWLIPLITFLNQPKVILVGVAGAFCIFLYAYRCYQKLLYEAAIKK